MQSNTCRAISAKGNSAKCQARLAELANGMRVAQALYVATELQIADYIAYRPLTGCQLAAITETSAMALTRVLRALCAVGVLAENCTGQFSLTEIGQLLRTDVPSSFRDAVRFMAGPTRWRCWAELLETVRSGINRPEATLGMHLFDYYAMHPAESEIEANAMRAFSALHLGPLIGALELNGARTIVDVGGGTGGFLAGILKTYPAVRGVLFDLPGVVKRAPDLLGAAGVRDRCEIQSGSFFESVPGYGDIYLLKQILHDWDDDRAVAILEACRSQMTAGSKLIVIERIIPKCGDAHLRVETFLADLEMLVMTPGGRERSEQEFRALFDRAGLVHLRTVGTESSVVLVEGQSRHETRRR